MAPQVGSHTAAFIARLETSGLDVGDHEAPKNADRYAVVYLIAGGEVDGTINEPDADGRLIWQVTSVGRLAAEAMWVADKARTTLIGAVLAVTGRSVEPIQLQISNGVLRDDDAGTPDRPSPSSLFYCTDRYWAWSFPA